jgi:hypothetical protein
VGVRRQKQKGQRATQGSPPKKGSVKNNRQNERERERASDIQGRIPTAAALKPLQRAKALDGPCECVLRKPYLDFFIIGNGGDGRQQGGEAQNKAKTHKTKTGAPKKQKTKQRCARATPTTRHTRAPYLRQRRGRAMRTTPAARPHPPRHRPPPHHQRPHGQPP